MYYHCMIQFLSSLNNQIFFSLNSLRETSPILEDIILFFAKNLDLWFLAFGVAVSFFVFFHFKIIWEQLISRKSFFHGIFLGGTLVTSWFFTVIIKNTIAAPRPFLRFDEFTPLFDHGGFNSFPSGHATVFAALGAFLFFQNKKIGIFFLVIGFCIALARVASGIHFPIDILAGFVLGVVTVFVTRKVFKKQTRSY